MITTSTNSNFTPQVIITPNFPTSTPILGASSYYHPGPGFKISISSDTQNNDWYINVYKHDVSITNIDIKVIAKKGNSQGITFNDYEEKDGYTFSSKKINKKIVYKNVDGKRTYDYTQFKYEIKLINSPYIIFNKSNNPPDLYVKFHIYYTFNGEEKRTTLYRKIMEANGVNIGINNDEIKYNSISYTDRINWANALTLDSIYRPFFFNTALLFSGSTAQLFFSIANGCTYRQQDYVDLNSPQIGLQTRYEIGDINLKISHYNEKGVVRNDDMYELIIKDNYRNFSEIIYDNSTNVTNFIKEAHIRGIRGSGIYLPKKDDSTEYLDVSHSYNNTSIYKYIPLKTKYYNKNYEFITDYSNVTNITSTTSGDCENFTTSGYGLNVSFNVNDGAPDGVSYKTIGVEYSDIRFPNIIEKDDENKLFFKYKKGWDYNIRYFLFNEINIIDSLKKINVDDDAFFSGLTESLTEEITFNHGDNTVITSKSYTNTNKVLAIYFNDENDIDEEDDEGNTEDDRLFKYKKDTSKLLIIRIYDLEKNG